MEPITIIEGDDLRALLQMLTRDDRHIYSLRTHQTDDGRTVFKVNAGTWTPPLGRKDN